MVIILSVIWMKNYVILFSCENRFWIAVIYKLLTGNGKGILDLNFLNKHSLVYDFNNCKHSQSFLL